MRCLMLIAVAALLPAAWAGDTPRALAERGAAELAAGRYADALMTFDQALAASPTAVELWHNRAATLLQLGRFEEARQMWERVRDQSDAAFEARMVYNLGTCDYAEALTRIDAVPARAIALLRAASDRYLDALRIDPTLDDARANLELAQRLMQQLESQEPPPPEEEEGDPSQPPESPPSSPPTSRPSEPEAPQPAEPNEPQPSEEPPPPEASETPPQSQQPDAPPTEPPPGELPTTEPPADEPTNGAGMTPDLAQRLLQIVRDAEKARREELARRNPQRRRPAERDW